MVNNWFVSLLYNLYFLVTFLIYQLNHISYIENHIHVGHEVLPEGHLETDAEYHANYSENPVGYFGFAARTPNQKGLQFGFDFGLLHTGGPTISGIDESKVAAIKDNLAPNVLPNFQISVGYGF